MEESEISSFFREQTVLLTGVTGFMGKSCLDHLLRKGQVAKVYVIIRDKKGVPFQQRLHSVLNNSRLSEEALRLAETRVVAVRGDLAEPDLGLAEEDLRLLEATVSVIINEAANTSFVYPLSTVLANNVSSVQTLLRMARRMPNIKAFIHVSTAYSNFLNNSWFFPYLEEKIYDFPMDYEDLEAISKSDIGMVKILTPKILGKWPNTYILSKAMAESVLQKESADLPVAIFRPSLVISAMSEPEAGWLDSESSQGFLTFLRILLMGVTRIGYLGENFRCPFVPVDYCSDIVMAMAKHMNDHKYGEPPVFNLGQGLRSPLFEEFAEVCVAAIWSNPVECLKIYYSQWKTKRRVVFRIFNFFLHTLPFLFYVLWRRLRGRRTRVFRLFLQYQAMWAAYEKFLERQQLLDMGRSQALWRACSKKDREIYQFDLLGLDLRAYCDSLIRGFKKFVYKESEENLASATARIRRLYAVHLVMKAVLFLLGVWILYRVLWPTYVNCISSIIQV